MAGFVGPVRKRTPFHWGLHSALYSDRLSELNASRLAGQRLVQRQRDTVGRLQVQRLHPGPLAGQVLHGALNGGGHVQRALPLAERRPRHPAGDEEGPQGRNMQLEALFGFGVGDASFRLPLNRWIRERRCASNRNRPFDQRVGNACRPCQAGMRIPSTSTCGAQKPSRASGRKGTPRSGAGWPRQENTLSPGTYWRILSLPF